MTFPEFDFKASLPTGITGRVQALPRPAHETVGLMDEAFSSANDYDHYLRFAMPGRNSSCAARALRVRRHGRRGHGPSTRRRATQSSAESCGWPSEPGISCATGKRTGHERRLGPARPGHAGRPRGPQASQGTDPSRDSALALDVLAGRRSGERPWAVAWGRSAPGPGPGRGGPGGGRKP